MSSLTDADFLGHARSHDLLELAFETSRDAICVLSHDGVVLDLNTSAAQAFGLSSKHLRPFWLEFWNENCRSAAATALAHARAGKTAELRSVRQMPDGNLERWISDVTPLRDNGSEAPLLLATSRNVTAEHVATRALEKSERVHRALIEATSEIVWHFDVSTGVTDRQGWNAFTGQQDDPADVDGWLAFLHPDDREKAKIATDQAMLGASPLLIEYRLRHRTGEWRWVEDQAVPLLNSDRSVSDWVGVISDVHDRRIAEAGLRSSEERLRLAVEATRLAIWEIDIASGKRSWSAELLEMMQMPNGWGATPEVFLDRIHPEDRTWVDRELRASLSEERDMEAISFRLALPSGAERWVEARHRIFRNMEGVPNRLVGTLQDITGRKMAEREIWRAAYRDALTGAPNRALFQIRLDEAIASARADDHAVGVILIDLDNFKDINDSLGHGAGDALLRATAKRLQAACPLHATVARLGGDEFGIVVPLAPDGSELASIVDECLAALRNAVEHEGKRFRSTASLGWTVFPEHDGDPETLLKNADLALYAAKSAGRNAALPFESIMREEATRRLTVLRQAEEALVLDRIVPFYQPKLSLVTGQVLGFEALLRWTDERGLRSPGEISEAFDDPALAIRIGARMLEKVIADMREWTAGGIAFGHVAINIGAPEFRSDENNRDLPTRLSHALAAADLPPSSLHVEITERVLLDSDAHLIAPALQQLHQRGFLIALDDFGTGYASLTHLQQYPVSFLKIDRSFVSQMETDKGALAIVRALVGLARGLKIVPIAEGAETETQLATLRRLGCDVVQGFVFGKPMIGTRVSHYLASFEPLQRVIRLGRSKSRPAEA